MPVAAFDTLKYVKQLKLAGVPEEQAEAMSGALADALLTGIQDLATKSDIASLKSEILLVKKDAEQFRQETKNDLALLKKDVEQLRQETKSDIALIKKDLEQSRQETKSEIGQLRQEMKSEIVQLRQEMKQLETHLRGDIALLRWMFAAIFTGIVAIGVRLFLFPVR